MKRFIAGLATFAMLAFTGNAMAVNVVQNGNGTDLVNTILGGGISVSNITYTGAAVASGTFSNGFASGLGIDTGILLTSGFATNAVGPNSSTGITGSNGLAGDADLTALIPGYTTYDATSLQFDFTSTGGDLFFNYVFGSDEYNEWVGSSFNDVFGFFLDGVNIALIPGTTTAVSINNVNLGSNSAYYNNNPLGSAGTEYDGFTDVFTASALGLSAGTHHIKLAIADAGDYILDSGVFIQAGSFSDQPTTVPEPSTLLLLGSALTGLGIMRKRFGLKG